MITYRRRVVGNSRVHRLPPLSGRVIPPLVEYVCPAACLDTLSRGNDCGFCVGDVVEAVLMVEGGCWCTDGVEMRLRWDNPVVGKPEPVPFADRPASRPASRALWLELEGLGRAEERIGE